MDRSRGFCTGTAFRKERVHARGSITIFLCILLSVLVPLMVILTDIARLKIAQARVGEAVRLTVESMLAGYERPLRDQYGLLALAPMTQEERTASCLELLRQNLEVEKNAGVADPFGFRVVSVDVQVTGSLDAPETLHPYLAEYMRYRAPVQLSMGFVEKLKALTGSFRQARCIETEMELDRLRAVAREDLVRLHLLKAQRLDLFGKTVAGDDLLQESQSETVRLGQAIQEEAVSYRALRDTLQHLLPQSMEKQLQVEMATDGVVRAEQALEEARAAMRSAQASWESESGKEAPATENPSTNDGNVLPDGTGPKNMPSQGQDVDSVTEDDPVGAGEKRYLDACAVVLLREASLNAANASLQQASSTWKAWHETQWLPLEKDAEASLETLGDHAAELVLTWQGLVRHLHLQSSYLEKAVFLANGLLGQLAAIDAQTAKATGLSDAGGAAVSTGTLEASVVRKPGFPTADVMDAAKAALSGFLARVRTWLAEAVGKEREAQARLQEVEECLSAFVAMKSRLGGGAQLPMLAESFYAASLPGASMSGLAGMGNELENAVSVGDASTAFTPNQPPSARECAAYREWFAGWSGEIEEQEDPMDDSGDEDVSPARTLQALRDAAGKTAASVREGQPDNNGGVIPPDRLALLPSLCPENKEEAEGARHPYVSGGSDPRRMHEQTPNPLTNDLGRVTASISGLEQIIAQSSEVLMRNLWADAYLLSAFTHAVTPEEGIPNEIVTGRSLDENAFRKGEVEYILFGRPKEQENLLAMKGALFAVRLALNLVHVHASAPKRAATLALATTLAGWTVFGIPVVQNFLMIAWAAAESFSDLDRLLKGEAIPLVKTDATWFLSVSSLRSELVQNLLLDPLKGRVAGAAGSLVGDADAAVRDTIGGWLDAAVDGAFAPLEVACADFGAQVSTTIAQGTQTLPESIVTEISHFVAQLPDQGAQQMMEGGFADALQKWLDSFLVVCTRMIAGYSTEGVVQIREGVKAELRSRIFQSTFYKNLVEQARTTSMGLTERVFDGLSAGLDGKLGPGIARTGLQSGIAGRMATMNYQEYLAFFLLLVPQPIKTVRAADLIQLNLQNALTEESYTLHHRYTRIRLETTVEMDFWFLPESFGRERAGNRIMDHWEMEY